MSGEKCENKKRLRAFVTHLPLCNENGFNEWKLHHDQQTTSRQISFIPLFQQNYSHFTNVHSHIKYLLEAINSSTNTNCTSVHGAYLILLSHVSSTPFLPSKYSSTAMTVLIWTWLFWYRNMTYEWKESVMNREQWTCDMDHRR